MKRYCVLTILVIFLASIVFPHSASADIITKNLPDVDGSSYIVYDSDTGEVLVGKKYNEAETPAQMVQIMTALVVIDSGNLTEKVKIPKISKEADSGKKLYLREGEEMSLENLLEGIIIYNANDAAYAAAEFVGGDIDKFVDMMNEKAKKIGLENTVFKSPLGPQDGQKTTAKDMAKLAGYALKNEKYASIATQSSMNWSSDYLTRDGIGNLNEFKKLLPESVGLKITDSPSGSYGFVAGADLDGRHIVGVIFGAPSQDYAMSTMAKLLELGADGTFRSQVVKKDQVVTTLEFSNGKKVPLKSSAGFTLTVPSSGSNHIYYTTTITKTKGPIHEGEEVGTINVFNGKKKVKEIPLLADGSVGRQFSLFSVVTTLLALLYLITIGLNFYRKQQQKMRRRPIKVTPVKSKNFKKKLNQSKRNPQALPPASEPIEKEDILKNPSLGSERGRQGLENRLKNKGR